MAVILITGASSGIGAALAREYDRRGHRVALLARRVDRIQSLAHELRDARGIACDVCDDASVERAFDEVEDAFGRIDVVVANAGVGVAGLFEDIDPADWDRCIDVNLRGTINTVLPALERMCAQRSGSIVLMASLSGLTGTPLLTPYAATKSAIVGLGAGLRPEAARHGIGVTTVCPGPVHTPLLDEVAATPGMSVRRYLTSVAGKPLAPATLAAQVVDAVRANRATVIPGRARLVWTLSRFAPRLTRREIARGMKNELAAAALDAGGHHSADVIRPRPTTPDRGS